jgi:hypothetical protein
MNMTYSAGAARRPSPPPYRPNVNLIGYVERRQEPPEPLRHPDTRPGMDRNRTLIGVLAVAVIAAFVTAIVLLVLAAGGTAHASKPATPVRVAPAAASVPAPSIVDENCLTDLTSGVQVCSSPEGKILSVTGGS